MPRRIPNDTYTVKKMKDYIRTHKLNRPDVKLGMKRQELINGLKKAGHWDTTFSGRARKPVARMGRPKKPAARKPAARKQKCEQNDYFRFTEFQSLNILPEIKQLELKSLAETLPVLRCQ